MILHGDCRVQLATLQSSSIDSIVTDPPYELGFMGKQWDASGIAYDPHVWAECLRVLKPGGHLCAFGGTRTYHRMVVAIEDAGFEIRDSIHWLYGSGFPKSLDVSKAIDKQRHDRADIYRVTGWVRAMRDAAGITNRDIDDAFDANGMGRHWTDVLPNGKQPAVPTLDQVPTLLDVLGLTLNDVPDDIRTLLWDLNGRKGQPGENWWKREIVGSSSNGIAGGTGKHAGNDRAWGFGAQYDITAPATVAAARWAGWGTALKPAHEPIVLARKPLMGTVASNVLAYGTGALNIDASRISTTDRFGGGAKATSGFVDGYEHDGWTPGNAMGRWPANIILTHAPDCADNCAAGCPVATLNEQSGERPAGMYPKQRGEAVATAFGKGRPTEGGARSMGDSGGAARYFTTTEWHANIDAPFLYVAKPSRNERDAGLTNMERMSPGEMVGRNDGSRGLTPRAGAARNGGGHNFHPTVKPVALMRHLIKLVTPPGGTVLDPFLGSGTTAVAATLEGFTWVGCELTADYLPIIEARVAWATTHAAPTTPQLNLFTQEPTP